MKVKSLHDLLEGLISGGSGGTDRSDYDVVVAVERASPAIGPSHAVSVASASTGFDWNSGKVILSTTEPVYADLANLKAAANFARRVRGIMKMNRGTSSCFKMIEDALAKWDHEGVK